MSAKAAIPLALLLFTPFDAELLDNAEPCISSSFYGNFRDGDKFQSVFIPRISCIDDWITHQDVQSASVMGASRAIDQLVWVEKKAIDPQLEAQEPWNKADFMAFLDNLSHDDVASDNRQELLAQSTSELLYYSDNAALLSLSSDKALTVDTLIPRFWKSTLLPKEPVRYVPVSSGATARVRDTLSTLQFDPDVAAVVNSISVDQIKNDIRFLTGEDPKSGIISRHSFAEGSRTAAAWLKSRIEDTGAVCELKPFLVGFAPNVVCRYAAIENTTETVLISAHYDSRGSFGSTRAPGGDDDGSGTTGILNIARTIGAKGIKFLANVELVLFAGEEQGLLGSKAYSRELKALDANLTLVIQADMTAYHQPGEPAQLGLPQSIGSSEVADLVLSIANIYSPELTVGYTAACCSDHQSFHEQGFPATQVFERAGPIIDPMYHNSGDLSEREGYDFDQLKSIAKFATVLHVAGFELTK
ncbi:hypothetical protein CPB85DRAFT_1375204 [Mucidula mucida]|nr:hypothetical protein CPB85DRAFT_1375204 [Mucidula mucida]